MELNENELNGSALVYLLGAILIFIGWFLGITDGLGLIVGCGIITVGVLLPIIYLLLWFVVWATGSILTYMFDSAFHSKTCYVGRDGEDYYHSSPTCDKFGKFMEKLLIFPAM